MSQRRSVLQQVLNNTTQRLLRSLRDASQHETIKSEP
jgi:hypothetical protein